MITPSVRPKVFSIGIPSFSGLVNEMILLMEFLKSFVGQGEMESINGVCHVHDIFLLRLVYQWQRSKTSEILP
jgi:hypothetical protein